MRYRLIHGERTGAGRPGRTSALTDVVVPLGPEVGVVGETAFEHVEAVARARLHLAESRADWTRGHACHGLAALGRRVQLSNKSTGIINAPPITRGTNGISPIASWR